MSYTRKQWLDITQEMIGLVDAVRAEDWGNAVAMVEELNRKYRRKNPDWLGTALTVTGSAIATLPNPAAVLLGGSMIAAARGRGIYKALESRRTSKRSAEKRWSGGTFK